jgi:hypothetical protein
MRCEYLGYETHTTGPKAGHERQFCTQTFEACLIDDPLGYQSCTRRTWLLMQSVEPEPAPKPARRSKRVTVAQIALL